MTSDSRSVQSSPHIKQASCTTFISKQSILSQTTCMVSMEDYSLVALVVEARPVSPKRKGRNIGLVSVMNIIYAWCPKKCWCMCNMVLLYMAVGNADIDMQL